MIIGVVTVTFNSSSVLDDFFTSIEQQDYPTSICTLQTINLLTIL